MLQGTRKFQNIEDDLNRNFSINEKSSTAII